MSDRLDAVLAAIDEANAADPHSKTDDDGQSRPAELLYGLRMSRELERLYPDASEHLRIAARGQHIERWKVAREEYPEGRAGYLKWRSDQAARHAERVGGMMAEAGYEAEDCAKVETLLRKENIKRNPEMQRLEDVICFVFIRWYLKDFGEGRDDAEFARIIAKTARKMSAEARERALREFDMPAKLAEAFNA
jgi:hypothetical protein